MTRDQPPLASVLGNLTLEFVKIPCIAPGSGDDIDRCLTAFFDSRTYKSKAGHHNTCAIAATMKLKIVALK